MKISTLKKTKKKIAFLLSLVLIASFGATAFATYLDYGYISPDVGIRDETKYAEFYTAAGAWTNTPTKAYVHANSNSNSWITDNTYATTWQALYEAIELRWFVSGRATKFAIKLNNKYLKSCNSNEITWTIVHELGHALCQADNPSNNSTPDASLMNYGSDRQNYSPRQYDINGVNSAFP